MTVTYTRLENGAWGVRIARESSEEGIATRHGMRVAVLKRDGTVRHAVLDTLVARFNAKEGGGLVELWSIRGSRPNANADHADLAVAAARQQAQDFENAEQAAKAAALAAERAEAPEGVIWVEDAEEKKRTGLPW